MEGLIGKQNRAEQINCDALKRLERVRLAACVFFPVFECSATFVS